MSNIIKTKKTLEVILQKTSGLGEILIEVPKNDKFGDLSSNIAMIKAKELKQNPFDLAQAWAEELLRDDFIKDTFFKVEAVKPGFINFFYNKKFLVTEFNDFIAKGDYGRSDYGRGKKLVIEYSSPNTNKPLHVGHLRNNALGMALANTLEFLGFEVIKTEVVNDRGIHIMKSMLAYKLYSKGKTPESEGVKSDKFVGDYYVLYSKMEKEDPTVKDKAQEMLLKWEEGDKEVRELWEKMNRWAYDGWGNTYSRFNSQFDKKEYESELYDKGKEIVEEALKKGLVKKDTSGAVVVDLASYGLGSRENGEKILLRPDGTTVYITQDIFLAKKRYEEYNFDKLIYVVGDEQVYHFKVLFKLLEILGFEWHKKLLHYPYAHVLLPEGKMKSREGKVVDADDLLEDLFELAKDEIKRREKNITKEELNERGWGIALAAVKYWFLKSNPKSELMFNPKESLDFEGNTGPYLLYTFVRLNKILEKSESQIFDKIKENDLGLSEEKVLRKISEWPLVLEIFNKNLNINSIAEYAYQLSSLLNNFYQNSPVLKSEDSVKKTRLVLLQKAGDHLNKIMGLLNLDIINKM